MVEWTEAGKPFVRVKDAAGNEFICPLDALKDPKHATEEEEKYMAGILRAYGKRGLYALLVYGIGAKTADRVLRKLHKDEVSFFLDLIEEQKKFIKNKKYWSVR